MDDLVMRSVYLRPSEDSQLRQLAHELNVTKSDLIRSAISTKLREWRESNSNALVMHDLQFGRRDSTTDRTARTVAAGLPVDNVTAASASHPLPRTVGAAAKKPLGTRQKHSMA